MVSDYKKSIGVSMCVLLRFTCLFAFALQLEAVPWGIKHKKAETIAGLGWK